MAGSSKVVDLFFRKQFRLMEGRARKSSRANMRKPTRRELSESDEVSTFNKMLTAAITFFEGREDEVIDLPPDSPEKLTIEAVMGVLHQFMAKDDASQDSVRESAKMLSDKLRSMFHERSSPNSQLTEYINRLREDLSKLHNSIAPDPMDTPEGDGEGAEGGEGGDEGGDEEAGPKEAPEEPEPSTGNEAEGESLAKQLGLS